MGASLVLNVARPDLDSLVLVLAATTLAALLSRLHRTIILPTVVVEIVLGIVIGPDVLDWASPDAYILFLENLGLAFLFFFAGLEVVEKKVPRGPLLAAAPVGRSRSSSVSSSESCSMPPG